VCSTAREDLHHEWSRILEAVDPAPVPAARFAPLAHSHRRSSRLDQLAPALAGSSSQCGARYPVCPQATRSRSRLVQRRSEARVRRRPRAAHRPLARPQSRGCRPAAAPRSHREQGRHRRPRGARLALCPPRRTPRPRPLRRPRPPSRSDRHRTGPALARRRPRPRRSLEPEILDPRTELLGRLRGAPVPPRTRRRRRPVARRRSPVGRPAPARRRSRKGSRLEPGKGRDRPRPAELQRCAFARVFPLCAFICCLARS
jgi:hypothetical protein